METKEKETYSAIILNGFIENVDEIPGTAKKLGLNSKISTVLHTYLPQVVDACFVEDQLVLDICASIAENKKVEILIHGRTLTLKQLKEYWSESGIPERELFEEVKIFSEKDELLFQILGIPYYNFGGPGFYGDSTTLHIFCRENDQAKLASMLSEVIRKHGYKIQNEVGARHPIMEIPHSVPAVHRILSSLIKKGYWSTEIQEEGIHVKRLIGKPILVKWSAIKCLDLSGLTDRPFKSATSVGIQLPKRTQNSRFFLVMMEDRQLLKKVCTWNSDQKTWYATKNVLGLCSIDKKDAAEVLSRLQYEAISR